jgi:hypothetical protein
MTVRSAASAVLVHYTDAPTEEDVRALAVAYGKVVAANGQLSLLVVIDAPEPKVGPGVREQLGEVLKRLDKDMRGVATVIRTPGLKGTMVRTFLTGLNMITRTRSPTKVFSSVDEGAAWLSPVSGQPNAVAELLADFAQAGAG